MGKMTAENVWGAEQFPSEDGSVEIHLNVGPTDDGSCTVMVQLSPTGDGTYDVDLVIGNNDEHGPRFMIECGAAAVEWLYREKINERYPFVGG